MKANAIILTAGVLAQSNAKTAHGLIRSSSRFNIVGVIDNNSAGEDAGYIVDKTNRGIPVYATLQEMLAASDIEIRYAIVGIAFAGGKLPASMLEEIKTTIEAGISIVSGLHDFLSDIPELVSLAATYNVELVDIRKPRHKNDLKFWSGEILQVTSPVIGVLGTDCALGKRTTAVMITAAMKNAGYKAHMVFTGQTGWLQGHKYGFILDSTYNDFISGELEHAVVTCFKETAPDVIFLEGQSSLCNPSGPCGAEFLLSAQCKAVILQHSPSRKYYNGQEHTKIEISLQRELDMINLYGSSVIAITLNTKGLNTEQSQGFKTDYENQYNIPVVLPLEEGMDELVEAVKNYIATFPATAQE